MKRTTSLFTAGAMGLGTFALVSAVAPSIASANGCGVTTLDMAGLQAAFNGSLSGFGDGGNAEMRPDGLHMTTDASENAWVGYFMDGLGIPLADATAPSNYALDVTQAAGQPLANHPTYEMWVDLDGPEGELPSWLVYYQPATGDPEGVWWSETALTEVDPEASEATDEATLVDISAAYPDATIETMGFQIVYSPDADAVVHGMTFGCNDFVFSSGPETDPQNVAPIAAFTATATGADVAVDANASSDADGTIATYAWDFGDGATGTGATASHTYAASGTYTVSLTVTDDAGATGSFSQQVTVTVPGNGGGDPTDPAEPTEYDTPLPNTGADVLGMAAIGGLVLAGGGAGLVVSRRRKANSAS
ncbi:PKD domain-containing protein [Geodermatophilus sp. SYSU D01186]